MIKSSLSSLFKFLSISPKYSLLISFPNTLISIINTPKPPPKNTYLKFNKYENAKRPKKSTKKSQKNLNVKTLIITNKKIIKKHNKTNITTYILTIINIIKKLSKLQSSNSPKQLKIVKFSYIN